MITRRGSVFWLDLWCGKHRVRRSLHTTERAVAIERARDLTVELRRERPPGVTFADFIPRYLDWARQAKPSSARDETLRAAIIKSWAEGAGLPTLASVTPYHVEQFRAALLARPIGKKTGRTVSRSTVNRYTAELRTMYSKARDWGEFTGDNPVSRVKFYREGAKIRPLSDVEVERVLDAADALAGRKYATRLQQTFPAICRFILQTGLRRSEALHLRWSDIGDGAITVRGKGGKTRTIPLNAEAQAALAGTARVTAYVFDVPNRDSGALLRRLTETLSKNAGVKFHVHQLRHKFASNLLARGVDVVTISQLLGHSAFMTTLLYSHSNPRLMLEAVTSLGHRQDSKKRK